jgi:hypothetical protein
MAPATRSQQTVEPEAQQAGPSDQPQTVVEDPQPQLEPQYEEIRSPLLFQPPQVPPREVSPLQDFAGNYSLPVISPLPDNSPVNQHSNLQQTWLKQLC